MTLTGSPDPDQEGEEQTPRNNAAEPDWSTLEQQLAASKVIPGSALERLIRDNQQLEMLRPEEMGDRLG